MPKVCIVCDSKKNEVAFREHNIDILRCARCGHIFSSYDADQHYDGYFGAMSVESEEQFWWDEAHRAIYSDFCKRFIAGRSGRLLDVGCGLGYFVKTLSLFPSWEVVGCEISKPATEFARTKLGLQNIVCGKVEDCGFPSKRFDVITMWDVIEHIPNPRPLLSACSSLLTNEGLLFIHTPNVRVHLPKARLKQQLMGMRPEVHYLEAKDHVNLYSKKTIVAMLHSCGFKNVRFTHLHPIQSVSGSKNLFLIFLKNVWFYVSMILFQVTFGRINLNNLFVIARNF